MSWFWWEKDKDPLPKEEKEEKHNPEAKQKIDLIRGRSYLLFCINKNGDVEIAADMSKTPDKHVQTFILSLFNGILDEQTERVLLNSVPEDRRQKLIAQIQETIADYIDQSEISDDDDVIDIFRAFRRPER